MTTRKSTGLTDSFSPDWLSGCEVIEDLSLFVEAHPNISQSFVCLNSQGIYGVLEILINKKVTNSREGDLKFCPDFLQL